MKKRALNALRFAAVIILILITLILSFKGGAPAFADVAASPRSESVSESYDGRDVLDDLQGSTTDGKPFDLKQYSFNQSESLRVFSFVEFCYSFYVDKQSDFGLYVYIYNPQGTKFVLDSKQNKIELGIGDGAESFGKYSLRFLNSGNDPNYSGLFLKYKVQLTAAQKLTLLESLNSTERVYTVSGVELLQENAATATDYAATGIKEDGAEGSVIYRYRGYTKGYGADSSADTLTVSQEEGEVLRLKVKHTSYRQKGVTNGKDIYTQDSLNSVYFAIPKTISKKYGYLSEIHAEWRNAVTSWGLCTGNREVYEALYKYVGQLSGSYDSVGRYDYSGGIQDIGFSLCADYKYANILKTSVDVITSKLAYNPNLQNIDFISATGKDFIKNNLLRRLNWLFSAGDSANIADRTVISSETLSEWYKKGFAQAVGENYKGSTLGCKDGAKIYEVLFDYVDELQDYRIKAADKCTLISQKWTQNFWDKLAGSYRPDGAAKPSEGIEAIHEVTDGDFSADRIMTCDRLYISATDYDEFKTFYNENKAENNIYLLRFAVTDYKSMEVAECKYDVVLSYDARTVQTIIDTNAYFFKQSVFLDFDIIDVTYSNGKVETVIPVVSNPLDVFPEATPPVFTTDDRPSLPWWAIALIIIGAVLAGVLLLYAILPTARKIIAAVFKGIGKALLYLFTGVGWLVCAPFRGIAALIRKRKARPKKRPGKRPRASSATKRSKPKRHRK